FGLCRGYRQQIHVNICVPDVPENDVLSRQQVIAAPPVIGEEVAAAVNRYGEVASELWPSIAANTIDNHGRQGVAKLGEPVALSCGKAKPGFVLERMVFG